MSIELDSRERKARALLIRVAKNSAKKTVLPGLISYKDFWQRLSSKKWTRAYVKEIIGVITTISAYELDRGRPMLNELVVNASGPNRGMPGEPLPSIRKYIREEFGVSVPPYKSHREAQQACWAYWGKTISSALAAEEGELEDRTVKFRKRNSHLIVECKKRDECKCRTCGFRLKVGNRYIIDCHHLFPLGNGSDARLTSVDDLVCLCPTCHRIAHTRRPQPLLLNEIKIARSKLM